MLEGKNLLVSLTKAESMQCVVLGGARRIQSKFKGERDSHGMRGVGAWDNDIEGAMCEMAMAKLMGVYFDPTVGTYKGADLGEKIQVRGTSYKGGKLIVRENDAEDEIFVLMVKAFPRFRLVGWMRGADARRDAWFEDGGNKRPKAWFVPQAELHPFPLPKDA